MRFKIYYKVELQIINLIYLEIFSIYIAYILPNASFLVLWLASTLPVHYSFIPVGKSCHYKMQFPPAET